MAYVKTVWEDNKTPLDAANLNKMEEGIENAVSLSETNEKDISTLDGQVAALETGKQGALIAGAGIEITTNNVVTVNKDAVPYFPTLDKNKYSLLSWDKAKQGWLTVDFSTEPSALSVARRTTTGQIKCEAPTENKAAVNKVYADSNYALCKKARSEGGMLNLTTTLSNNSCATIEFVGHGFNAQGVGSFYIHIGNTYVLQLTAAEGAFWVGGTLHILQNADKAVAIGKYVDINLDEHEIKIEIERPAGSFETSIEIVGDAGAPADAGSVMLTYSYPGTSSVVNEVTNEME